MLTAVGTWRTWGADHSVGPGDAGHQRTMIGAGYGARSCIRGLQGAADEDVVQVAIIRPGLPKVLTKRADIFETIRKQDILLHHPFQSFEPVIRLLQQAADDPHVVAIRMTVYRTGTESVLMEHLLRAAQKGKEVTVVVELMARFDEEANMSIAARLEEVGAHVVYGVVGYKTHAKMLLVLRREDGGYRRYVHLGTGNYHPRTTGFYTDFGLMTCNPAIGDDVQEVFKQLTGLGRAGTLTHLWQAPFTLHGSMMEAIAAETTAAQASLVPYIEPAR